MPQQPVFSTSSGSYKIELPARRTKHLRFNDLQDSETIRAIRPMPR
jgi:hypothetical protein